MKHKELWLALIVVIILILIVVYFDMYPPQKVEIEKMKISSCREVEKSKKENCVPITANKNWSDGETMAPNLLDRSKFTEENLILLTSQN